MTARSARLGGRRSIGVGRTAVPLGTFYGAVLALLYLPIAILFLFSFSTGTTLSFPIESLTFEWYSAALGNEALLEAARNSLLVGVMSATIATTLGGMVAVAVLRFRFPGRSLLLTLAVVAVALRVVDLRRVTA